IACKGRADLQLAVTQEQGFEMTVLRLLAFRPLQPHEIPVTQATPAPAEETPSTRLQPPLKNSQTEAVEAAPDFDEFSLEDTDKAETLSSSSEPSSDDFLEDEVAETESGTPASSQTPDVTVQPVSEVVRADTESASILFDPESGDALFGFEDIATETVEESTSSSDDFLLAEYLPAEAASIHPEKTGQNLALEAACEEVVAEQQLNETAITLESQPRAQLAKTEQNNSADLMPQDILKTPEQVLEGEWTVEK